MMSTTPDISVILSVYNDEAYVAQAVRSIIQQDFPSWELIVVDDGSTDATWEALQQFDDERIRFHRQENRGLTASLNLAISLAQAELIVRQDSDDLSTPDRLTRIWQSYERNSGAVLFYSDAEVVDEQGRILATRLAPTSSNAIDEQLHLLRNPFVHGSLAFPKEALRKTGGYDESFRVSQDFDLILRLYGRGEFCHVSGVLYRLRIHERRISAAKWWQQVQATARLSGKIESKTGRSIRLAIWVRFWARAYRSCFFRLLFPEDAQAHFIKGRFLEKRGESLLAMAEYTAARRHCWWHLPAWYKQLRRRLVAKRLS